MVRYPGYLLHAFGSRTSIEDKYLSHFEFSSLASLHEWYEVRVISHDIRPSNFAPYWYRLVIILYRPRPSVTPEIAFLVERTQSGFTPSRLAAQDTAIPVKGALSNSNQIID
jgi:hypothetical protein